MSLVGEGVGDLSMTPVGEGVGDLPLTLEGEGVGVLLSAVGEGVGDLFMSPVGEGVGVLPLTLEGEGDGVLFLFIAGEIVLGGIVVLQNPLRFTSPLSQKLKNKIQIFSLNSKMLVTLISNVRKWY
jgi:hypothetical protein